jgi:hypothetical protein
LGKNAINRTILSFFETMRKAGFIAIVITCTLYGCVKAPTYPDTPHITFKSVSSTYVKSGDRDTVTISFTDGDGDIGVNSSTGDSSDLCGLKHGDSTALHSPNFDVFLIDNRDTCINAFASANVQPSGKYKDISGDILVILAVYSKKCFATPDPTCPLDTVTYSIILRDQAQHFSNIVKAAPVTVDPH